jgi:hypothetical protein
LSNSKTWLYPEGMSPQEYWFQKSISSNMALFANMAKYGGALAVWCVTMSQILFYVENQRIHR